MSIFLVFIIMSINKILSIDIGGTTTKLCLFDNKLNTIKTFESIKTKKGHSLKWLFDYINKNNVEYDCIGIDVPGFYNPNKDIIEIAGNLNYKNFDIKKEVKKYTDKDVYILNDANAAALGEYSKIANESNKNVLFYVIGTGLGGAIILDGKLYQGNRGYAGEFGHGYFNNKSKCTCGLNGCVEPLFNAAYLTKQFNKKYKQSKKLIDIKNKSGKIELHHLVKIIKDDESIKSILRESLDPLIKHMSIMSYAFDPDAIIIGGGPSGLGKPFLDLINEEFKKHTANFISKNIKIKIASLKNKAQLLGNVFNILNSK